MIEQQGGWYMILRQFLPPDPADDTRFRGLNAG
jgi:hypothetical protein